MRVETVCTGDELLTGLTADTNSTYFQRRLLERLGLQVMRSAVVGDVHDDIISALREAGARSDAVLVSGGMGPTSDDLTMECAARLAGVGMYEDPATRAHLEARFKQRGFVLSPNNLRQALIPVGATAVINQAGSAPMVVQKVGACTYFYVPGVPSEYRWLAENEVIPRIAALAGTREVRLLKLLKTVGLPESHLDQKVLPLHAKHPKVVFGFRTHAPENHLKLLATGATVEEAQAALAAAEADSRAAVGPFIFGADDETLAGVVGKLLRASGATLAAAESCTGGRISALITAEAGASDWFRGGAVTYAESAKQKWLGVEAKALEEQGAVSEAVAAQMAKGVRESLGASWGISATGYAGPTGGDAKNPVGTVYLGLSGPNVERVARHLFSFNERERVQQFATYAALDMLRRTLQGVAP